MSRLFLAWVVLFMALGVAALTACGGDDEGYYEEDMALSAPAPVPAPAMAPEIATKTLATATSQSAPTAAPRLLRPGLPPTRTVGRR